ncbi:MAG: GNAT family N-acetyltransferase [Clostridia bacterium]|nr:GNAT family N-acetyltransferase [Clostridia bacterium]
MEIRKLNDDDVKQFCSLILDMYKHLENLEWFSPMPFDEENVKIMINKPRFYIVGAFEDEKLCGVASLDYKCGKLIGKVNFPKDCDTNKLVETGFSIVHSSYRGRGIMKEMVKVVLEEAKNQGYQWVFGKVHKDNLASSKSLKKLGFEKFNDLNKEVKVSSIIQLLNDNVLNKNATQHMQEILDKNQNSEFLIFNYDILMKKL